MTFSAPASKLQSQPAFDYQALPLSDREYLQHKTSKIKSLVHKTAEAVRELGKDLAEVRDFLRHNKTGGFDGWLQLEFQWQRRTAYNYIAVYEKFGNCAIVAQFAPTVLYLLAAPSTPEEARQEAFERAAQGELITCALAKQIRSYHTIDVEAETVANDKETPDLNQASLNPEPLPQPEKVDEPLPPTTNAESETKAIADTQPQPPLELSQASKDVEDSVQTEPAPVTQFEVGDRVRILRRQLGKDNWSGNIAQIWELTPDGWLRVDVEGHEGVRFTLHPDWVERMPEETPEQHNEQLEQVLSPSWANEPEPESPTVTDIPPIAQREGEAAPHVQPGDWVFLGDPNQQGQRWIGEVAEVIEAAEDCIKLIVELRPSR